MTLRECAELMDTPIRKMPMWAYLALARTIWRARLSEAPPGHRVLDPPLDRIDRQAEEGHRLAAEAPARETFEITMRAHGKLPPAEPPSTSVGGNGVPAEAASSVA